MTLDVFRLRESVVSEYRDYVQSFVRVLDDRIDEFISSRLAEGELWPAAELQLNPAFEMDRTLRELAEQGSSSLKRPFSLAKNCGSFSTSARPSTSPCAASPTW